MNCECFYLITNQSLEGAREFAKEIKRISDKYGIEYYPVYICKAIKSFAATTDYDNWRPSFTVKKNSWLVFVAGKYHNMMEQRPKGGKRGFPNRMKHRDFGYSFYDYIEDVEPVK